MGLIFFFFKKRSIRGVTHAIWCSTLNDTASPLHHMHFALPMRLRYRLHYLCIRFALDCITFASGCITFASDCITFASDCINLASDCITFASLALPLHWLHYVHFCIQLYTFFGSQPFLSFPFLFGNIQKF